MEGIELPLWAVAIGFLLNAFKGYLPTVKALISDKNGIKDCKNKCDELSKEILDLKEECLSVSEKYEKVNNNYYILLGSMSVIKTKMSDLGFDDITMLTKEADG